MAQDEDNVVPEINFPKIPDSIEGELRDYLLERDRVLRDALKGSLYLLRMFEDGIFGN
jgi:hypothetical protein